MWTGYGKQKKTPQHESQHERRRHVVSGRRDVTEDLVEVRETHVIAESVGNQRCSQVT